MTAPRPIIAMLLAAVLCGALACVPVASGQAPGAPAAATLAADPGALRGHVERLRGVMPDAAAGATVQVQRLDPVRGWVAEATTTAATGGAFVARWRPRAIGRFTVRAVAGSDGARAAAVGPTASVTVYRPARATWYGPGMYGHHTACGQVLSHRIMGVAHKTLPCGTPVEISFAGKTVTVPVIDRGPFSNGAHYDLTSAVAQQIGMTETSIIGVMPQRGATMEPPLAAPAPFAATGGAVPPGA